MNAAERLEQSRDELRSIQRDVPSWSGTWYAIGRAVREVEEAIQMADKAGKGVGRS